LAGLSKNNEFGITLISLDENFRKKYEPYSAPYNERIKSLHNLHKKGLKTWASIEPYPTPNIVKQDFLDVLKAISFVDKIVFGRLNYNPKVTGYPGYKDFYNKLGNAVREFCRRHHKAIHIKEGTMTGALPKYSPKPLFEGVCQNSPAL
jgi:DNA repair photolyase